jgi:hypothetical protein
MACRKRCRYLSWMIGAAREVSGIRRFRPEGIYCAVILSLDLFAAVTQKELYNLLNEECTVMYASQNGFCHSVFRTLDPGANMVAELKLLLGVYGKRFGAGTD